MSVPDASAVFAALETTWPPVATETIGPFVIRRGGGGGKRVSAATVSGPVSPTDLTRAEEAMRALGQDPMFMLRGASGLDAMLADAGYDIVDPTLLYALPTRDLTMPANPRGLVISAGQPLAIMREIWAEGGVGSARLDVMRRADIPKIFFLGRAQNRPAGVVYAARHRHIAMLHALEIRAAFRRSGLGRALVAEVAEWSENQGASHIALAVTRANIAANRLYASLAMSVVGQYHYRIKHS